MISYKNILCLIQVLEFKAKDRSYMISLSVDDIGIRKFVQLVKGGEIVGYPELGLEVEAAMADLGGGPTNTPASHIMVFMITTLNDSVKFPCVFFVIDNIMSGEGTYYKSKKICEWRF